jgi:hypothetical protein
MQDYQQMENGAQFCVNAERAEEILLANRSLGRVINGAR